MTTWILKGIELLEERAGQGRPAEKGDEVTYNARMFLRRGDEVTFDSESIACYGEHLDTQSIDGNELVNHTTVLGKRRPIAGVEKSLFGMQAGGYREVMVAPHLAYGEKGIPDRIPANAMLRIQLWVQDVKAGKE